MPKERHQYIHDSATEPSPHTPAQRAFFRYRFTLGSYEYSRRHGPPDEAARLDQELDERYEEYRTLRDHPEDLYSAGDSPAASEPGHHLFLRERMPFDLLREAQVG